MKLFFACLGFTVVVVACVLEGAHLAAYVQGPALMIVVGGTFLFALSHHSLREVRSAFCASFSDGPVGVDDAKRYFSVLSTFRILALALGGLGFVLGLIHIFSNLDDPSKIGPGVAVALTAPLYVVIFSEILVGPLINRLSARVEPSRGSALEPAEPKGMLLTLCIIGGLTVLFIVLYAVG
jgi:flagellar motor component MotA